MTVTVQAGGLALAKGQNRTVFRNPRGLKRYYSFYWNQLAASYLVYEYSSDGVTWSTTQINVIPWGAAVGGAEVYCFDVKMHDDGFQLEVWVVAIGYDQDDAADQTKYVYGTIADTDSTITWSTVQDIDAAITSLLSAPHCIALARTDNDEIVVAFTEDFTLKGKDYRLTKLIGSNGSGAAPTWSGEVTWDDSSGSANNVDKGEVWFGLESFSSSYPDDFLIYAKVPEATDATTYDLVTAVPDWDQGGAGFTNLTQAAWATIPDPSTGDVLSALIDDNDIAHLVYFDHGTLGNEFNHRKAGSAGDDNLGATTTITSGGAYSCLTITLDTGTDLFYVFFRLTAASVDWRYTTSPIGAISFSDQQVVSYHQDIIALSSWNRQIENSLHIAGQYGTTVVYNEHPVYKALSTTLADFEFPDQNYYLGPHSII